MVCTMHAVVASLNTNVASPHVVLASMNANVASPHLLVASPHAVVATLHRDVAPYVGLYISNIFLIFVLVLFISPLNPFKQGRLMPMNSA